MKKKIILTFVLIFSIIAAVGIMNISFAADSGSCGTGVSFSFSNGVLTISGDGAMRDYYDSSTLKPWALDYKYDRVKELVIEEGVTYIGSYAFANHDYLEKVTIADSVTGVGEGAFYSCDILEAVNFGSGVETVENSAFGYCTALTHINIKSLASWCGISFVYEGTNPLSADDGVFTGLYLNGELVEGDLVIPEGVTKIGDFAFCGYDVLTSVSLPASLESISGSAFLKCYLLNEITLNENNGYYSLIDGILFNKDKTELVMCPPGKEISDYIIPDGVTHIGEYAFSYENDLKSVTVGDGVTDIGNYAFSYCEALSNLSIGKNVTNIGEYAFYYCQAMEEIVWNAVSLNSSGDWVFHGIGWKSDGVKVVIGDDVVLFPAIFSGGKIISVVIGSGETTISEKAFYNCQQLTDVTFLNGVTTVGNNAFAKCTMLSGLNFGNGSISIGSSAFSDCDSLETLELSANIASVGYQAFYDCDGITDLNVNTATIGNEVFYSCGNVKNLTIGENVSSVGKNAFSVLVRLEKIYWNAKNIADMNITDFDNAGTSGDGVEVVFGDTVEAIPANAFSSGFNNYTAQIPKIKSITIGKNVTAIGNDAFFDLRYLEKVIWNAKEAADFPKNSEVFYDVGRNTDGVEFIFGDDVINIPAYILYIESANYKPKVMSIKLGKNIQKIGAWAFYSSDAIISPLPESVTTIGHYAFGKCTGITEMVIGDNVTSIASSFMSDSSVKKLYWNNATLTNYQIGVGTNTDVEVIYGDDVTSIPKLAFTGNVTKINLNNVTTIDEKAFYNCQFVECYEVSESNPAFSVIDGMLFSKDGTKLIKYVKREGENSYVIPDTVTDIAYGAFSWFSDLEEITLSKNIKNIENYAFYYCKNLKKINWNITNPNDFAKWNYIFASAGNSDDGIAVVFGDNIERLPANMFYSDKVTAYCTKIKSITLPDTITSIPDYAFAYCGFLTDITIPDTITSIGEYAFRNCLLLEKIYWNAKEVKDFISSSYAFIYSGQNGDGIAVVFGNSVTTIPAYTFYGSTTANAPKLKSVRFGNSVTKIGDYAFYNCTTLENVYFVGTESEKAYSVGANNDPFKSLSTTYSKGTRSTVSSDRKKVTVTPVNVESGIEVIVALYKNGAFVGTQSATYTNGELSFDTNASYTDVKIMLWNELGDLKPLCEAENIQ